MPAGAAETFDQRIAALAIDIAHLADAIVRAVQRRGRRDLDRREGAIIEIGFHPASAAMMRSLPTAKPMRQPGIEKVFDIEVNSTVTSIAPGTCKTEGGGLSSK